MVIVLKVEVIRVHSPELQGRLIDAAGVIRPAQQKLYQRAPRRVERIVRGTAVERPDAARRRGTVDQFVDVIPVLEAELQLMLSAIKTGIPGEVFRRV